MKYFCIAVTALLAAIVPASTAQQASGVAVNMVVTAEARHGQNPTAVDRDDVLVYQGKTRDRVTSWLPAQGDHPHLDLFILLDDSSGIGLDTQLKDIHQFINVQPATTRIGVAYMQNGIAQIVQSPTDNHAQAAKSLRLPLGVAGINASPYFSLSDLVKRWPAGAARREVVMVTDGIDRYYGMGDLEDPYVSAATQDAQRAGIVVYAIYNPGTGHYGHSYWRTYWGQIYLSQLTDETGGESYYIGFTGAAVAFAPFLDSVNHNLRNQYLLTFLATPDKKNAMQQVKVTTERRDFDLVSADRVYVPGGQ